MSLVQGLTQSSSLLSFTFLSCNEGDTQAASLRGCVANRREQSALLRALPCEVCSQSARHCHCPSLPLDTVL